LKVQPLVLCRIAAALLLIASIVCLFKAVTDGSIAEQATYNLHPSEAARLAMQRMQTAADRWGWVGWSLQFAAAAVLSGGIESERVVRRVFVALGVVILTDGVLLLLMALIVR